MKTRAVDLHSEVPIVGEIRPERGLPLLIAAPHLSTLGKTVSFDFRFAERLGGFARKIAEEFLRFIEPLDGGSARTRFFQTKRFFNAILLRPDCVDIASWDAARWKDVVDSYVKETRRLQLKDKTKNDYRLSVVSFLKHLQLVGLLPSFKFIQPIRVTNAGKVLPISHLAPDPDVTTEELSNEDRQLVEQLAANTDAYDVDHVQTRIEALEIALLEHWTFEARQAWNQFAAVNHEADQESTLNVEEFLVRFSQDGGRTFTGYWRRALTSDAQIVRLVKIRYEGILPAKGEDGYQLTLHLRVRGAARRIASLLHSTIASVTPFYAILLSSEFALNPSSVRTMTDDSLIDTDNPNVKKISWKKGRTGETYAEHCHVGELGQGPITEPQAIRCLQAMRAPLLRHALPDEQNALLLIRATNDSHRKGIKVASDSALRERWKVSLASRPVLSRYRIRPVNMRSTKLYKEFIESGGDLIRVNKKAHHKAMTTTQQYVNVNTSDFFASRDARRVQDFLLLKATPGRHELHQRLGLTSEDADRIVRSAERIGFLQWDLPDAGSDSLSDFEEWMTSGEIVLIESVEVAAELFAFRRHLLDQAEALRDDPSWLETWAVLLLFLNAAWSEIRPDIRSDAEQLAKAYRVEYGDCT